MSLPNELLREIFQHTHPIHSTLETGPGPSHEAWRRTLALIFVLRSVCRRFRAVANELSYWTDERSMFEDIIPKCWRYADDQNETIFLETLLADRHLACTLSNRHSWSFSDYVQLKTVLDHVPFARENTNSISIGLLDMSESPTKTPKQHIFRGLLVELKACPNLKFLEIGDGPEEVVLDLVSLASSCPLLETLRLDHVRELAGTLSGFCNLKELRLRDSGYRLDYNKFDYVFPLYSAASLRSLTLLYETGDAPGHFFSDGHFDSCKQLNTCIIAPFTAPICQYFHRMRLENLKDFRVQVAPGGYGESRDLDMNRFTELFRSPSFRTLRSLSLTAGDTYHDSYYAIVDAVTSNLLCLQSLAVSMGLNTAWCSHFTQLVELDKLVWHVGHWEYQDSDMTPIPDDPPYSFHTYRLFSEHALTATSKFNEAFQRIGRHPNIKIKLMLSADYDESVGVCGQDGLLLPGPTLDDWRERHAS
jgi:hypothetical protein